MSKQITVIRSTTTRADKGYPVVEVAYKTDDGKTKGMKILGFGPQKEVADAFKDAQPGNVYEVDFGQNDRGYWQFTSAKNTGTSAAVDSVKKDAGSPAPSKGNWETTEERAARQVLIVKQSSLGTAVDFLMLNVDSKKPPTKEQAVELAKYFEAYVFDKLPKDIE